MIETTDALYARFRQAMDLPVEPSGEALARQSLQGLMNELLARRDMPRDLRLQNMLLACRLRLRAVQNISLAGRHEEDFLPCRCEIREYIEDLCAAADMLLRPQGRRVRFEAPEEAMECLCTPRDIGWLVLELVCNCALHCRGEEIAVTLEPRGRRRYRAFVLTVACAGTLDLDALHASGGRAGSGVAAMRRAAWRHHGALLSLGRDGKAVAALRLGTGQGIQGHVKGGWENQKSGRQECRPYSELPDYVELLRDPCSQVYIALAPAVGE